MMKRFLLIIALFALISPLSAQDILDGAYKKDIRYFDVARVYGESEEFYHLGLENKINLLDLLVLNGAMSI